MDRVDGYVGELEYVHGFYPEMGPLSLNLILLLQGIETVPLHQGFTYCDLGCGQALTSNMFAACHQEGDFHAIDFNHSHIEGAKKLAQKAGLTNTTFWEAKFSDMPELPLPDFDFIVLHGVYSWVNGENRHYIRDFIRQKLKVGGAVYVSYNSLPGWSTFAPLRQLMTSYADSLTGQLEQRINTSLAFIEQLKNLNLSFFKSNPAVNALFDQVSKSPRNYLAHEYFNRDWTLFYHSDVANDFSTADMTFAGSAVFADNLDFLRFSDEEQQVVNGIADQLIRETVKDFAVNQRFRRDIFTRKRPRLAHTQQKELFDALRFTAVLPAAKMALRVGFTRGEVQLPAEVYGPVIRALTEQPRSLNDLLRDPETASLGRDQLVQVLMVLRAANYILPASEPSAASVQSAKRFNLVFLEETIFNMGKQYLGSPLLQTALPLDWVQRLLLLCELTESKDPLAFVWELMLKNGKKLEKNGICLETPEENIEELKLQMQEFYAHQLPLLSRFGII